MAMVVRVGPTTLRQPPQPPLSDPLLRPAGLATLPPFLPVAPSSATLPRFRYPSHRPNPPLPSPRRPSPSWDDVSPLRRSILLSLRAHHGSSERQPSAIILSCEHFGSEHRSSTRPAASSRAKKVFFRTVRRSYRPYVATTPRRTEKQCYRCITGMLLKLRSRPPRHPAARRSAPRKRPQPRYRFRDPSDLIARRPGILLRGLQASFSSARTFRRSARACGSTLRVGETMKLHIARRKIRKSCRTSEADGWLHCWTRWAVIV